MLKYLNKQTDTDKNKQHIILSLTVLHWLASVKSTDIDSIRLEFQGLL